MALELGFVILAGDWKGDGLGLTCMFALGAFGYFDEEPKCAAE